MEVSGQIDAQAALPQGKEPQYLMDRRRDGIQSRSGCGGEEKKYLTCPCPESNPDRPAHSLVTILTELPWHEMKIKIHY
jgi:hypothetical protein